MIPLLPATCPPPARFARYRRGEHLRRDLLPGPAIPLPGTAQPLALPAPAQAVAPESLFSYDNAHWRRVAPAPRRECLLAVENLLDQLALYLTGELTETQFDEATRRFRCTIFKAAPTPVIGAPKLRREPDPLRAQGNLPWSRPQRPVITRPAAMSDEGKQLLAFLEHGPVADPFKTRSDAIDEQIYEISRMDGVAEEAARLNKIAADAGRKKAQETLDAYQELKAARQNRTH